ncbi:magnesium transporter [Rhodococcoides trifolii]|uniref:Magnesium transporter n=1 Tax=Rhodococcoides trifolii TaxID=908250 RepID=A0A917FRG7_9NOCA|nr:magnesium transporter CorA family protein [Rhodococcus trifolii]GGF97793.1 magnesium transporter [Rhodococcus trifolii]
MTDHNGVRTRAWHDGKVVSEGFALGELSDYLAREDRLVWVDLCSPDHDHLQELAAELSFDRNAVEDAISEGERPKATRYAHHTFVSVYATQIADSADDESTDMLESRVRKTRVSAFVFPRGMVTVRSNDLFDMDEVITRWESDSDMLALGVGALVHGLLDVIVDGHFDTIGVMDDAIESLEDSLFDDSTRTKALQQYTYRVRKELVELRRVILPMREVVNGVMRERQEINPRGNALDGDYADLYDHIMRATEWTESLRDMVGAIFETNLSLQDIRMNIVMKQLTGWAAIIAVPTAVTGWFGQNVAYPGFGDTGGLVSSTVVIIGSAGGLYVLFKKRGWL